jgi:hypothetical protein
MIVLGAIEISSESTAGIFLKPRNFPSGETPNAAAVQDLNNDGTSDVATANGDNVSIFLNNGNGSFALANTFSVGEGATEIASADLNGDGNADLVVTDDIKSAYTILGNGDGTFAAAMKISLHTGPGGIAVADLNGDSVPDLAIAIYGRFNQNQGEVAILIGVGDGTFAAPVLYSLAHDANGLRLVATDLNHDGKLDLAVALQHFPAAKKALAVLLGNGDGTFQPATLSVPGEALDVAAADFNGDGNMDLALARFFFGDTAVLLGNGDGTFQPLITYPVGGSAETIAIGDLNRDGLADLVVGGDQVATLLGKGDGTFSSPVLYGVTPGFARIGYFNPDRNLDVVGGGGHDDGIVVALGTPDGAFKAPLVYPVVDNLDSHDVADFDNDGKADVVASGSQQLLFLRGLDDGTFAEAISFDEPSARWMVAADFNGDRNSDVLLVDGSVDVVLGNGDGTFQPPITIFVSAEALWPAVGDFNHDGHLDVALTAFVIGNDQLIILLGNGDGTFQPERDYDTGEVPQSTVTADFNVDGNLDVAVSNTVGGTVGVYLGHGDGSFDAALTTLLPNALYSATADLNKDGNPDLVVAGIGLQVLLGNGDGTFGSPSHVNATGGPVKIADIDRDGRLDIAVSADFDGLAVLRGRGDGTFRPAVVFSPGSIFTGSFVLKDLNRDRTPEAIVDTLNGSLAVLVNISGRNN